MRATEIIPASSWAPETAVDRVRLTFDERNRRRLRYVALGGTDFVLDLPRAMVMHDGDGLKLENGQVTFRWKDYARGNQQRSMTLKTNEFIRRFLLHVLPRGFQRLRQFGLLANRQRRHKLALCRTLLGTASPTITNQPLPRDYQSLYQTVTGQSLKQCPACRAGTMKLTQHLAPLASALSHYARHSHSTPLATPQTIDSS